MSTSPLPTPAAFRRKIEEMFRRSNPDAVAVGYVLEWQDAPKIICPSWVREKNQQALEVTRDLQEVLTEAIALLPTPTTRKEVPTT